MASHRSQPRELDWPSTHGITVYNLLSFTGRDLTRTELMQLILRYHDATCTEAYRDSGIAFLLARNMVKLNGEQVVLLGRDPRTRQGRRLCKSADYKELVPDLRSELFGGAA